MRIRADRQCGSFFKNPQVAADVAAELKRTRGATCVPGTDPSLRKLSAAWMIETSGWKGYRDIESGAGMPACPLSTRWCWSTTAMRPAHTARPRTADRRIGALEIRRDARTRAAHHRRAFRRIACVKRRRRTRTQATTSHARSLLMVISTFMFGFMALTIRYASKQLHPFEIAFFRNLFVSCSPCRALAPRLRHLRTQKISLYFMRCAMGIISMLAAFWSIVNLPLAQATSLTYSTRCS